MVSDNDEQQVRFEFRIFGQGFGREIDEIRRRSLCFGIEEVQDIYLVTAANEINNVKIRGQSLEMKVLLRVEQGLELWKPCMKLDFPLAAAGAVIEVFQALAVELPALPQQPKMHLHDFMMQTVWPHPGILVAEVFKRRSHFEIGRCMVEIDELLVNGAAIQSISIEGEDAAEILRVKALLDVQRYPNISYLLALKRIMGLVPLLPQSWLLAS